MNTEQNLSGAWKMGESAMAFHFAPTAAPVIAFAFSIVSMSTVSMCRLKYSPLANEPPLAQLALTK